MAWNITAAGQAHALYQQRQGANEHGQGARCAQLPEVGVRAIKLLDRERLAVHLTPHPLGVLVQLASAHRLPSGQEPARLWHLTTRPAPWSAEAAFQLSKSPDGLLLGVEPPTRP